MNDLKRGSRVDLNLFRVFDAIYRAGSLTRAAVDLHLTQPAVSNALARLRAHFDDPLFVRSGRSVAPTPLAHEIVGDIYAALQTLQGSVLRGNQFRPDRSTRRFAIGMRDSLEFVVMPPLLRKLQNYAPQLAVHSVRVEREQLTRQLAAGDLSLALDVPQTVGSDVHQRTLFKDPLCVVMRHGHPLASAPLTASVWLAARHVTVSARISGPVFEDLALRRQGLDRDVSARCQHYYSACHVAAASDLLLTAPRHYAEWFNRHTRVHIVDAPLELPMLEIVMYWHQSAEDDSGSRWLRQLIAQLWAQQTVTLADTADEAEGDSRIPAKKKPGAHRKSRRRPA